MFFLWLLSSDWRIIMEIVSTIIINMKRVITMVKDITPTTPTSWTVKVTVADKTSPRDARNSPHKFQRFVLADEQDNRVQLTLFGDSISMFTDRLEMYRTYYITDAIVKFAPPQYRIGPNSYQWNLHPSKSLVEEVEKDDDPISLPDSYYIPLDRLPDYKDSAILIDVLVVAIALLPVRSVHTKNGPTTLQELVVVDKSLCPVTFTLWGEFVAKEGIDLAAIIDQKPIIAALHVQVSSYNSGLSINSRGTTTLHIQPPTAAAAEMRSWLNSNIAAVHAFALNPDLGSLAKSFGEAFTKEISSLSTVKTKTRTKLFFVKCQLKMNVTKQQLLLKKCAACNRPTSAEIGAIYTCNFCKKQGVLCVAGIRVEVVASDESDQFPITLYDKDVAVFFRCDYDTLLESLLQNIPDTVTIYDNSDSRLQTTLQLKASDASYMGLPSRKFSGSYVSSAATVGLSLASSFSPSAALDIGLLDAAVELTHVEKEVLESIRLRLQKKSPTPRSLLDSNDANTVSSSVNLSSLSGVEDDNECVAVADVPVVPTVTSFPPEIVTIVSAQSNSTSLDKCEVKKRSLPSPSVSQPLKRELFPPST